MQQVSAVKMFGGYNKTVKHDSKELGCEMSFTVYMPPASDKGACPVVMYLSGLTCTNENFIIKAGAQRVAAQLNIALVSPDTSPRGLGIEGEDESYDFGTGASFYLDATAEKWKQYRMESYICKELMGLLAGEPNLDMTRVSLMGHSMGGHGALTLGLKHPDMFQSLSAFSPICNPCSCPWGIKAFEGYLGEDRATWREHDASELLSRYNGRKMAILVDSGLADNFYQDGQLRTETLETANDRGQADLKVRMQEGYDHSYFFIATFMEDHLKFHAKALGRLPDA